MDKMNQLLSEMLTHADLSQVAGLSRFFKTGPGQYGEGDKFLGIKVPKSLHDLLQKAVGWLLRDAGKRDEDRLRCYLKLNGSRMPRTMLRYAIEKFSPEERSAILKAV